MQAYPHHYSVSAAVSATGNVTLHSDGLAPLETAPPAEFGGPGDLWSPETLLVGAVADCFILSFKAIARASRLDWLDLTCKVDGDLDQVERKTHFTEFNLHAVLTVAPGTDEAKAMRLLEKAEASCLVTNSLVSRVHLHPQVETAAGDV